MGTTVSWEPSPLTPPTYTANAASCLSTVLNLRIILIMIKIKCLPKKRFHDLKKKNILRISKAEPRPVPRSPLPLQPWLGFDNPTRPGRALILNKDRSSGPVFFSCCLFGVCASCLNRVASFGGNRKNQTVRRVREGPTCVSTEYAALTAEPRPALGAAVD